MHDCVFVHYCTFVDCKDGPKGAMFGSEEPSDVWWHMDKRHGLPTPLGCPKCDKRFASKQSQRAPTLPNVVFWTKVNLKHLYVLKVIVTKSIWIRQV